MKKTVVALMVALILSSCARTIPLQRTQVAQISNETEISNLESMLGRATEVRRFEFAAQGKSFLAREYQLHVSSRSETRMICTPNCFVTIVPVPIFQEYVLVHEIGAQRLFAWGHIEELSKSPDGRVSNIMPALKEARSRQEAGARR
ncbi:MAG: hypothetical protein ACK5WN_07890 [Alphaproteobacteria bacterium]|jgi:hypothetical protein|nr:hypothetical protein [Roseomonas sp.]